MPKQIHVYLFTTDKPITMCESERCDPCPFVDSNGPVAVYCRHPNRPDGMGSIPRAEGSYYDYPQPVWCPFKTKSAIFGATAMSKPEFIPPVIPDVLTRGEHG